MVADRIYAPDENSSKTALPSYIIFAERAYSTAFQVRKPDEELLETSAAVLKVLSNGQTTKIVDQPAQLDEQEIQALTARIKRFFLGRAEPEYSDAGPIGDTELTWVANNFRQLRKMYGGEWIAVSRQAVIAHAAKPADLRSLLKSLDTYAPFVKRIPAEDEHAPLFAL